ncbi:hypothetical protein FDP41_012784 [Naegleria fowleri]|uniref:BTB domain-containing protein n=1 Tax=Naegleria fowleri TaxID=5763 RepID=A0A6A5C012_NAEFO|nr:uncharacterized protein FDP41_012784 [Naegleria fowleri]KAF0980996.1 hypothetical protein FDP41_012784 [Naegleria fowleri]
MDTIQSFLQREEKLFENEKDASILHQLKDYCLDYIGMNSEKEEFETLIKKDSNGRCTCELLDSVVKRKSVKKVKIDEIPSASSPTPLFELFQEKVGTDVELKLSSGKIVKCHKTILSSKIPYFDALFSGNWNSQEQVYGDEMEFIIEYCYGFVEQVPNPLIIPLMKKSHEFQLEELLKILQLALTISMGNFIETAQQLEEYWNELSFKVAKRKLIDFGIIIQWSLDVRERLLLSSKVTNQAFEFIRNEDVENLRNISNLSSFINDDDGDGYTLLFYACSIGRIDVMKFLLTVKGIDVNKKYRIVCVLQSCDVKSDFETFDETQLGWSPLSVACLKKHIEIVKLLLQHPNIQIDNTAKQNAKDNGVVDLEQLQNEFLKQHNSLFPSTSSSPFSHSRVPMQQIIDSNYSYWQQNQFHLLKKFHDNDQLFESSIIAFKPLLSKLVPSFHNQVLENKKFIELLNEKELSVLQSLVDYLIYGGEELKCDGFGKCLIVLFLLNRAEGDLISLKSKCVERIIQQVKFENILDTLDIINAMLKKESETFKDSSNKKMSILETMKEYCLDFLGTNSDQPGFEQFVENDERINDYLRVIIKRKQIKDVNMNEAPNTNISQRPLFDLLKESVNTDIEIKLNNGKIVKCHKTILIYEYEEEMEYIIQYCYGFMEKVPSHLIIPLMKKSHEFQLEELLKFVQSLLTITIENFFQVAQSLKAHLEEDIIEEDRFKEVRRKLVEFGVQNRKTLFQSKNRELITSVPTELKDEILMALANK